MDHLSTPGHLEKFEKIPTDHLANFMTGTKIASDWEDVKRHLNIQDPYLDAMVAEFVTNIHSKVVWRNDRAGLEIFESYSEKELKGKHFEIRFDANLHQEAPSYEIAGRHIKLEKVRMGPKDYWVGVVKLNELSIDTLDFRQNTFRYLSPSINLCSALFGRTK